MTANEVEIYRKIAVWRSRAMMLLLATLFIFPVLSTIAGICLKIDDVDLFMFHTFVFFFLPMVAYVVCIVRLWALMGSRLGCLIAFATIPFLFPIFLLVSLGMIVDSWRTLRKAGFPVGFFCTDWSLFFVPNNEVPKYIKN
jgi:hypothetical protein